MIGLSVFGAIHESTVLPRSRVEDAHFRLSSNHSSPPSQGAFLRVE
jgi:hypothetical protein